MESRAYKLGVIGAGKMGGALVRALCRSGALAPAELIVADLLPESLGALAGDLQDITVTTNVAQVASAQTLLIAVKPQDFEAAVKDLGTSRPADQLVVSVMAGVTIARIAQALGKDTAIVRVMPNIVCEVDAGAFGYAVNDHVTEEQGSKVERWLNSIGVAEKVPEALLDAVTGLSGSGPAFAAVFIEALADGGVAAGLRRETAQRLAAQTVLGAAKWVLEKGSPAALKDMVCSPAGTTIAGLRALERGGLRAAAIEAVVAAAKRSRKLGKQS